MAEHTPGPWQIEPGDTGDSSVGLQATPTTIVCVELPDVTDGEVTICTLHEPVYRVPTDGTNEFDEGLRELGTIEGNGDLIAAAPDLLAACRRMVEALSVHHMSGHEPFPDDQRYADAHQGLYDAIGKAIGGAQ